MQEIAEVPLRALTALHLLSRDLLAMTQGVSVQFRDAKDGLLSKPGMMPEIATHR